MNLILTHCCKYFNLKKFYIKFLFFLILTINKLYSQSIKKNVTEQFNCWTILTGSHKLNNNLDWFTELNYRRSDFINNNLQIQYRTSLDYKLNDNFSISPAYVYTVSYPYGKQPIKYEFIEHRPYEQLILKQNISRFFISHRYRLEQRIYENKIYDSTLKVYKFDKWLFKGRLRYRLLINIPINKNNMNEVGTLFFQTSNEVFISFGEIVGTNIFDQNRISGGFGYKFNKEGTITIGYLLQQIFKSNGTDVEDDHTLTINLNYNLDFTKKKKN